VKLAVPGQVAFAADVVERGEERKDVAQAFEALDLPRVDAIVDRDCLVGHAGIMRDRTQERKRKILLLNYSPSIGVPNRIVMSPLSGSGRTSEMMCREAGAA